MSSPIRRAIGRAMMWFIEPARERAGALSMDPQVRAKQRLVFTTPTSTEVWGDAASPPMAKRARHPQAATTTQVTAAWIALQEMQSIHRHFEFSRDFGVPPIFLSLAMQKTADGGWRVTFAIPPAAFPPAPSE